MGRVKFKIGKHYTAVDLASPNGDSSCKLIGSWEAKKFIVISTCYEAVCIYEPRGDHGLEGFDLNESYWFEKVTDKAGSYYRMYLQDDYYETCSITVFNRYFKEV